MEKRESLAKKMEKLAEKMTDEEIRQNQYLHIQSLNILAAELKKREQNANKKDGML